MKKTAHVRFRNVSSPLQMHLVSLTGKSYLPQVLKSGCYYSAALQIDCLQPPCTSCSCCTGRGRWQLQRVLHFCWQMLETSSPGWLSATSAGCCPSSSKPERSTNKGAAAKIAPICGFWQLSTLLLYSWAAYKHTNDIQSTSSVCNWMYNHTDLVFFQLAHDGVTWHWVPVHGYLIALNVRHSQVQGSS